MTDVRSRRLILAATSLGSSLAFLDGSVVNVALPHIGESLDMGLAGLQWTVLAYLLTLSACMLGAGAVADRIGLRRAFVIGVIAFAVASLAAGLAPTGWALVAARALQGVGASMLTATSLALLRVSWGEDAGKAIGLWTSLTSATILAGPPIGGAIVEVVSWRWIFVVNVPLAVITVLLALAAREAVVEPGAEEVTDAPSAPPPPDVWSLLFAAVAVAALTGALVEGHSIGTTWSLVLVAISVLSIVGLQMRHRRFGAPALVPGTLLRQRVFQAANGATFLIYAALGGLGFFSSVYLQAPTVGYSAFTTGMLQVPSSLILLALGPTFGRKADKNGPRRYLVIGPLVLCASALMLATVTSDQLVLILLANVLCGIGLAIFVAPITATALRAAPERQAGIASAANNLAARIGSLFAIAALGLAAAAVWENQLSGWTHFAAGAVPDAFSKHNTNSEFMHADELAWQAAMIGCALLAAAGAAVAGFGLRGKILPGEEERISDVN